MIFKEVFFAAQLACRAMKTTYHTITFEPCSENFWALKVLLTKVLCENFKEKKIHLSKIAMLSKNAILDFRG